MYKIRRASLSDIPVIMEIFRETILTVNRKDYTQEQVMRWAARGEDSEKWAERIKDQYFIVAEAKGYIVGFCSLCKDGYIDYLYVHKDLQGKGVATILLNDVERQAKKDSLIRLWSDVSLTARNFMEHRGYNVLNKQTIDIGISIDNYRMEKNL